MSPLVASSSRSLVAIVLVFKYGRMLESPRELKNKQTKKQPMPGPNARALKWAKLPRCC